MFVVAVIAGGSQKVQSRRKNPEDAIQGYFILLIQPLQQQQQQQQQQKQQ